jgi:tetratricopeptide (TPR) repeat protein
MRWTVAGAPAPATGGLPPAPVVIVCAAVQRHGKLAPRLDFPAVKRSGEREQGRRCPCRRGMQDKDNPGVKRRAPLAIQSTIQASLLSGLAAQQNGRLLEAAECYEQVLELDPASFDATHMLGVVQYHRGRFDDALRLLTSAMKLRPDVPEARNNFEIVDMARQRERQLCRAVLPRLAPLVFEVNDVASFVPISSGADLVIAQTLASQDEPVLESVLRAAHADRVRVWTDDPTRDVGRIGTRSLNEDSRPSSGVLIFFGAEFSARSWLDAARPERTLLVVTRDSPGQLLDRIRELSGDGRRSIGLLCASAALATRVPLPAGVIMPQASARSICMP